ncbi:hypothetical protein F5887DRAFT_1062099 [Amanita rubescens]|nr:hypothetical protein F5887DRAFT_1062099 [Amanita rubescens]
MSRNNAVLKSAMLLKLPTSTHCNGRPINWARVPEASKKYLLDQYGYDWETEATKPLPETVADLAKMFDETKFFGYFVPELLTALMDISEFGLEAATPTGRSIFQVGPLIELPKSQDYDEEKMVANETAIAKEFDVKLERDVSRGMACLVGHTKTLGGWTASTAQSYLEFSQYANAIMELPQSHPMQRALVSGELPYFEY